MEDILSYYEYIYLIIKDKDINHINKEKEYIISTIEIINDITLYTPINLLSDAKLYYFKRKLDKLLTSIINYIFKLLNKKDIDENNLTINLNILLIILRDVAPSAKEETKSILTLINSLSKLNITNYSILPQDNIANITNNILTLYSIREIRKNNITPLIHLSDIILKYSNNQTSSYNSDFINIWISILYKLIYEIEINEYKNISKYMPQLQYIYLSIYTSDSLLSENLSSLSNIINYN